MQENENVISGQVQSFFRALATNYRKCVFSFLIGNFYFFLNVRMREFEALKVMKKWNGIAAVNCHQRKVCLWKRCEHFCKDIEDELFEWC